MHKNRCRVGNKVFGSELPKLYDENCFDLLICKEHTEDVFDAYKASNKPKKYKKYKCSLKCSNSYLTYITKHEDGTYQDYHDALEDFRNTYNVHMKNGTEYKNVDIYIPYTKGDRIIVLVTITSIIISFICFL
ncbi:CYIR protein [Plasmodium cynomolgi strain B]|uniref:CYIR protein n=1 Tax=Plasmodium cynomolgi (strain B) TaxID=1120755 RepID=K6V0Z8_PLACD|nr:CYIR protein [Plasmodium cynomolgi strain B]GAB69999.1 CYIR protein [Plasmodium cynomolgi strain B]